MDKWTIRFTYDGSSVEGIGKHVLHDGEPIPRVGERVKFAVSDIPSFITTPVRAVEYDYSEKEVRVYIGNDIW